MSDNARIIVFFVCLGLTIAGMIWLSVYTYHELIIAGVVTP